MEPVSLGLVDTITLVAYILTVMAVGLVVSIMKKQHMVANSNQTQQNNYQLQFQLYIVFTFVT